MARYKHPRRGTEEATVRIKGGLPLIARYRIHPPEPDVGIFHNQVEVDALLWPTGHPLSNKMLDTISRADWESIEEQLMEQDYV